MSALFCGDVTCIANITRAGYDGKAVASRKKIIVTEVEGGSQQTRYVNGRARAKHDAVWVNQEYAPVGLQAAEYAGRVTADYAVKYSGCSGLLVKSCDFVRIYREILPVDNSAGSVCDSEGVAVVGEAGLAVDYSGIERVSLQGLHGTSQ